MLTFDEAGKPQFQIDPAVDYDGRTQYQPPVAGGGPIVRFLAKAVQLGAASLGAGRPIWKTVVHLEIRHPGERDTVERMATEEDCRKYYQQWLAFKQARDGAAQAYQGTPLDTLFPQHPDTVAVLNFNRVYTVEQLAALTDTAMGNIAHGAFEWKQKATRYLEATDAGKGFAYLEKENVALQDEQRKLERSNAQLMAKVEELTAQVTQLLGQVQNSQAYGAPIAHIQQQPQAPQFSAAQFGIDPDRPPHIPPQHSAGPVIPPPIPALGNLDAEINLDLLEAEPAAPAAVSTSVPPSPPRQAAKRGK